MKKFRKVLEMNAIDYAILNGKYLTALYLKKCRMEPKELSFYQNIPRNLFVAYVNLEQFLGHLNTEVEPD